MAVGDTLAIWNAQAAQLPATSFPKFTTITNTSDPINSVIPVLAFDDTSLQSVNFHSTLPLHYNLGGMRFRIHASAPATGNAVFEIRFWNCSFGTSISDMVTGAFTSADVDKVTMTFAAANRNTQGLIPVSDYSTRLQGIGPGNDMFVRVTRRSADAADTLIGDARLLSVQIEEIAAT